MRSLRSVLISGWVLLILLATAGFAAFSTRSGSDVRSVEPIVADEALRLPELSGRVSAFVLAESLALDGRLPEPLEPPALGFLAGPDGLDATPLTTPEADPTTTTTAEPATTSTEATATTAAAEAPATTTTAPATTTTTAPPVTTTTAAPAARATTTTTAPPQTTTTVPERLTTTTAPATTTTTAAASGGTGVERWRGLVASYFPAERVEEALAVMRCESRGDPDARNPYSGAAGLFQFMPQTWSWASANAGFGGASVYDPQANVASAAWLVQDSAAGGHPGGAWGHWSCKP